MSAQPSSVGLYNRFELIASPAASFLLVASEAEADHVKAIVGKEYVVTTWPENEYAWCDLAPLINRTGLLIANRQCNGEMHTTAKRLLEIGCALRWTDTADLPADWTLLDFAGDWEAFRAWAKPRTQPYSPPQDSAPPPAARESEPPSLPDGGEPDVPLEAYEQDGSDETPKAPVQLSEDAFAALFAKVHGQNWRCVRAWNKWFFWDGEAWAEDRTDSRVTPMRELFRSAQELPIAQQLTDSTKRALLGRKTPMYSALIMAGTDKRIRAEPEIWDADPWALGVPGGVVDLKTGKLVSSARDQHVTMRCSVAPERGTPELWLKLLRYWLGGDDDMVGFLRRYLGYALTGDSREQCMAFFYGPAQAGKGTILRTVSRILGSLEDGGGKFRSYHYEAPISTFMESRSDRHSTEIAAFYKKRLITSEEPSAGAKWDESKLKWITGGSQITARFIAQDNFSFTMTGKIIVAANHRPRLGTTDKAIRRRLHVIPFEHPIADEDRDNDLDAKLREEFPRILHWLIEGCLEWQQAGLGLPEKISASTDQYLENEDTLGAWLSENCDHKGQSEGATLYENYKRWAEKQGETAWTRRSWTNNLLDRGFTTGRGAGGVRQIIGLQARPGSNL